MNRKIIAFIVALAFALSLAGCSATTTKTGQSDSTGASSAIADTGLLDVSQMFTDNDKEIGYDTSAAKTIELSGESVTISEEGTYVISGTLTNGQIIVDTNENAKVRLVLNGVQINSDTSAALYIKQADKVFVTLAQGSNNTLSNTQEFVAIDDNNIDGVVFSKSDLTFNGQGSLTVNAAYGHGIVCKDDLVFTGGNYTVNAQNQGVTANDSVRIADGTFAVTAGKDAIHAENTKDSALGFVYIANGTFTLNALGDGLDASGVVQVDNGTMNITAGGGSDNAVAKQTAQPAGKGERPQRGQMPNGTEPAANEERPADMPELPQGQEDGSIPVAGATQKGEKAPPAGTTPEANGEEGATADAVAQPQAEPSTSAESSATQAQAENTASTKGIKATAGLYIQGGTLNIDAQDDALHSNSNLQVNGGELQLSSGDDGIHADAQVAITVGNLTIAKSYEGIEGQSIEISGGTIHVTASDDGLNAAGGNDASGMNGGDAFRTDTTAYILISGGKLTVDAGGDGVDSNGDLTVTGGETYVAGPINDGNGALDYSGNAKIFGGVFVAVGSAGMAQNFGSDSTQGAILINTQTAAAAGTAVTLKNANGETLASYTSAKQFNSILISCASLEKGGTYTLQIGAKAQTITLTDIIYGAGSAQGGRMQGGKMETAPKQQTTNAS